MAAIIEEEPSLDQICAAHLKIRDEIAKIRKDADRKVSRLEEDKAKLDAFLANKLQGMGVTSAKTSSGTIMLSEKRRFSTTDWETMFRFIGDNDAFELLEKRIHQTNMRTFLEENPDNHPKNLNVFSESKITIRKS